MYRIGTNIYKKKNCASSWLFTRINTSKPNSVFSAAVTIYQDLVCIVCIFPVLDESSVIAVVRNW
jgi:hypothetical protein